MTKVRLTREELSDVLYKYGVNFEVPSLPDTITLDAEVLEEPEKRLYTCQEGEELLYSNPPQYRCKQCKQTWFMNDPRPWCRKFRTEPTTLEEPEKVDEASWKPERRIPDPNCNCGTCQIIRRKYANSAEEPTTRPIEELSIDQLEVTTADNVFLLDAINEMRRAWNAR